MTDKPIQPTPETLRGKPETPRAKLETPRAEPEILPPERGGFAPYGEGGPRMHWQSQGFQRIHIARIGPLRLMLWAFFAVLFVALILFLFAGALLIAVPVIAVLIGGSLVAARFRGLFRR